MSDRKVALYTLTGAVGNDEAKTHATEFARSVYGIKRVNNLLKVK